MTTTGSLRSRAEIWITQVGDAAASVGVERPDAPLRADLDAALGDPRLRFVVCGEWNTGKSTFINALLQRPGLLPTGITPTTSYVTLVESGDALTFTVRRNGSDERIEADAFHALTAEKARDETIEHVHVTVPGTWMGEEILLVDTPGLQDLNETSAEVTLNYLPRADVVVLTVEAVVGLKGTERQFVRHHLTAREARRVVSVVTQADKLVSEDDVRRKVAFCRDALRDELPDAPWVAVQALEAGKRMSAGSSLADLDDTGVPAVAAEIAKIARRERVALLGARFIRAARGRVEDLFARFDAEEGMLGLPLLEAEARLAAFKRDAAEAERRNREIFAEARHALSGSVVATLDSVTQAAHDFVARTMEEVGRLESLAAVRAYVNSEGLHRAVATELRQLSERVRDDVAQSLEDVVRDVISERIAVPVISPNIAVPDVDTIFRHLPGWVVTLVEVLITDVLAPGGFLTAVLVRFGLDKLIHRARGLPTFLPTELVKGQLVAAVRDALASLPEQVTEGFRLACAEAVDQALEAVEETLDRRVRDVEAGMQDAAARVAHAAHTVAARRAQLGSARLALGAALTDLETLTADSR